MRLNIGCGENLLAGFTNIDNRKETKADIICEIGSEPIPVDDNTVDYIVSYHSFEHFENFIEAVEDLARVSMNGAVWVVTVPYCTSTEFNLVNPYHKHPWFSEHTFRFFDDLYQRERPKWFTLIQHDVKFNYNTELWADAKEPYEVLRRKYLNVVTDIEITLEVIKHDA